MKRAIPLAIVVAFALIVVVFFVGGDDKQFDGERAMAHVKAIVDLGPRPPGSEALEASRQYLERELAALGWQTSRQRIVQETVRGEIEFINLRARFGDGEMDWKDGGGLALICSHYDTKFYDDFIFVGANDGGSSTGALVEIARVLAFKPSVAKQVELVFFDGEENIGGEYTPTDGLFGSIYYAKQFRGAPPEKKPRFGLLLDMIGEKDVQIAVPQDSPRILYRYLTEAAQELGVRDRFRLYHQSIIDDHVPLNQAGIPTIDIIDIEYPVWHTAGDTLDKLSAESLELVCRVTLRALESLLKSDVGR
ncbi:MAG: M28 family peptidase [Verrucomicrobiota bacterium]